MKKKRIAIIGGGFSGCVSAFLLIKLGYDVSLFEKGGKLGGTSSDIINEKNFFFNGPHYFDLNTKWVKEMMKYDELKEEFSMFETYNDYEENEFNFHGSYTDIFGKVQVSNFFAHPITPNSFKKVKDLKENNSLFNRVNCYQNNVSLPLKKWLNKNSLDHKKLHSNCAELLNIGRVCFINDLKKIKDTKKESKYADHILGVPEEKAKLSRRFCISKRGNNSFYEKLYFHLNKKIDVEFNSKIQIQSDNTKNIKI